MSLTLLLLVAVAFSATSSTPSHVHAKKTRCSTARAGLRFYQQSTHRWQTQSDRSLTAVGSATRSPGCSYVRWAARLWQHRSRVARRNFVLWFRAASAKWACIHSQEGSWQDEGLPQMGGLQMDPGFQSTYGAEFLQAYGDAGHWPVWAQLRAAERAFHGYGGYGPRGYGPWPNTARACGLG